MPSPETTARGGGTGGAEEAFPAEYDGASGGAIRPAEWRAPSPGSPGGSGARRELDSGWNAIVGPVRSPPPHFPGLTGQVSSLPSY